MYHQELWIPAEKLENFNKFIIGKIQIVKTFKANNFEKNDIEESKNLFLSLHAMVHSSNMSGIDEKTFEDELRENLDENKFRTATNEKGRTIAYGMWHSSRIEDITMNILVDKGEQGIKYRKLERKNKICNNGYRKCTN